MRCVPGLLVALVCLPGCFVFFDDGDDPLCYETGAAEPAPLRNPDSLTCESFGSYYCDPACGPCPEVAELAPIPSWPSCYNACEQKAQEDCEVDPQCRVVTHASCEIEGNCLTSFLGCFPVDTIPDTSIDCFAADAWDCSRSNECTALHTSETCGLDAECPRPFALCIPEGSSPGRCHDPVTCRAVPPACPSDTTPGILAGCYTGACIPLELCGPN